MKKNKNNFKKVEVIDMEDKNEMNEEFDKNTAEVTEVKTKMSLKKKLMIGGGVVLGLVLGAVALGSQKGKNDSDEELDDYESESEADTDETTEADYEPTEITGEDSDQTTTAE